MNDYYMNIRDCAFILLFVACISSCDKPVEDTDNDWENLDCGNLKTGIIDMDSEIVKSEVNKLVTDLEPVRTDSDPIGHKENLDLLIERLNTQCDNITAELICYACIETNPPQSEILVTTDSLGTGIDRVVDILTPDDDTLYCLRIHEYWNEQE